MRSEVGMWNAPVQDVALTAFVAGLCWCVACQIVTAVFGVLRRSPPP